MNSWHLLAVPAALVAAHSIQAAEPTFEIRRDDRVLIMGDTLLEREGSAAALESRLLNAFQGIPCTFRNLSFSADLPTGVSRASFDPASAGMERIREELALVKPTVAILGYGMAASLEEITYSTKDPNLNADPARYGSVFSADKFKADLASLMDAIVLSNDGKPVRFVLLAPLRHEDLRAKKPGLPDPTKHNALLVQYTTAIRQLAAERGARFVDSPALVQAPGAEALTDNGIHPSADGLERWAEKVALELSGKVSPPEERSSNRAVALRKALQRKNELFFHRWRPANHTYIFGFRKREQGRNAVEIEQFDALIKEADAAIASLREGKPVPPERVLSPDPVEQSPIPKPEFEVGDGLEISLWAENPLLSKPVEMNWDAKGRLWVASTPIYPQIQPGAYPTDRIFILEDTKHAGKADKVTLFANDLLIPTGIEPELGPGRSQSAYVGASTELLQLTDADGDGTADKRRVVLSGFGTEDTHHTLHTLKWGVDGRLYFSQSIYIHSHMETPWGVVRLNSGGVLAYDPRTERVEVFAKGLVNNWGHQTNHEGQSFLTDGAGSNGLSWAFPGATFAPFEGSSATMPGVSAGSYPKFCSLELIHSPLFPKEWQGHAITCDFRAHRMVRFAINDLEKADPPRSAYATADQPDVVKSPDQSFRPIDVKFGPDGALYVADWTNPVINHGEVDFRDPRRNKTHGRIWRIAGKGSTPIDWKPLTDRSTVQLLDGLLSSSSWEQQQSRRLLSQRLRTEGVDAVTKWQQEKGSADAAREAAFARSAALGPVAALENLSAKDSGGRAWEARWIGSGLQNGSPATLLTLQKRLADLSRDDSPRVRVEAMRALARVPSTESVNHILKAAVTAPKDDPQYAFAVKRSIREVSNTWVESVLSGKWDWKGRENELAAGLRALDPEAASPVLSFVMKTMDLPLDGSGPWLDLVAHAGSAAEVEKVWALGRADATKGAVRVAAFEALRAAAVRGAIPKEQLASLDAFFDSNESSVVRAAARLSGAWKRAELASKLGKLAAGSDVALSNIAAEALAEIGGEAALKEARRLVAPEQTVELRRKALAILVKLRPQEAISVLQELLAAPAQPNQLLAVWRVVMSSNLGFADRMAKEFGSKMTPEAARAGWNAAQELGGRGRGVAATFGALVNPGKAPTGVERSITDWAKLVQERGNALKGERIYHSAMMTCVQCHAIGGAGGKLGPDMSTLGASAPLDYIIESVLVPSAKVKEGYHGVSYSLTDGGAVVGIPFEENSTSIRVRMPGGVEMEVAKAKIKSNEVLGSLMPQGLIDSLSEEDKLHMFAFLGSVGRPGAFDASNGGVARAWKVIASLEALKAEASLLSAPAAYSLTDGRLLPEHLQMPLAAVSGADAVYAVTKLAVSASGRVRIDLEGVSECWIDGEKLSGSSLERELASGNHTLAVSLKRAALPEALRAKTAQARFIAP